MKRLVLAAILIFPVLSLAAWVFWGASQPRELPKATDTGPNNMALTTNAASGGTNGALVK